MANCLRHNCRRQFRSCLELVAARSATSGLGKQKMAFGRLFCSSKAKFSGKVFYVWKCQLGKNASEMLHHLVDAIRNGKDEDLKEKND